LGSRQEPDDVDAELLHVVELLGQSIEVADPVAVGIVEGLDVQLVGAQRTKEDCPFTPYNLARLRGRMDPASPSYRRPPAGWEEAVARLADERAKELLELKQALSDRR
jgi:hypothetical protein